MPNIPMSSLALTIGVSTLLLSLVSFAGFSAMGRAEAKRLTLFYILANLVLLLPTRDPSMVVGIGSLLLVGILFADWRWFSRQVALKSWDGQAVRGMLYVPLVLLIVRNLMLHGPSQAIFSFVLAVAAGLMFFGIPRITADRIVHRVAQDLAFGPALLSWMLCSQLVFFDSWSAFLDYTLVAGVFPVALLMMVMSFFATGSGKHYRVCGSAVAMTSLIGQLLIQGSVVTSLLSIITAIAVVLSSFVMEEKKLFCVGIAGLVAGLAYHLRYALELCQHNYWLALAVVGMVVVLLSSYVERNGRKCLVRFTEFRNRYRTWE
jgi:hypothetical protein